MTIKTTFHVGDMAYFIDNNKVCNLKVIHIEIHIVRDKISIINHFNNGVEIKKLDSEIFTTKEKLLASL